MGIKEKTKDGLTISLCLLGYIALMALIVLGNVLGTSSFNGVFLACQFALCILMVRRSHTKGLIISLVLVAISSILSLREILFTHNLAPLPGLVNTFVYVITLVLLSFQFRIREKEAVTDILTGLQNRRGIYRVIRKRIENGKDFHCLYIDLGNFKIINDNFGHTCGDILLKRVSKRMEEVVGNNGVVARIGGDEFVIVLDGSQNANATANRVLDALREKTVITIEDTNTDIECYLNAYIGISEYPKDSKDCEELIKFADIAMYKAVTDKSYEACFFTKDMEAAIKRRMELENVIKKGLEFDYFYLVYQPQYLIEQKKLRGFETLIRMKTPEGEFISPGEFIPVAESCNLILNIDDYVLNRAMREFKDIVLEKPDLVISINVSAKNIGNANFFEKLVKVMDATGFPASNLEIEITEYCLVQSMEVTVENIKKLRDYGVQVALDDFGTGYTSLAYLSKMPINLLKVDKSLVDDIESGKKSKDFVSAVISMGHLMGCEVISEGVEEESQLDILKGQGCDFVQGYVWGKPLEYPKAKELALKSE